MQQVNWALKHFIIYIYNLIRLKEDEKNKNRTMNRKSYSTGYINYLFLQINFSVRW